MSSEIKATQKTEKILVAPTLGTGTSELDRPINEMVAAGASRRYSEALILAGNLKEAIKSLGMPDGAYLPLTADWLAAFHRWITAGKRTPADAKFEIPERDMRIPDGQRDLRKLAKLFKARKIELDDLNRSMDKLDADALVKAETVDEHALSACEHLNRYLMKRLKVTYVLLSELEGDEETFEQNRTISLHVALVNRRTGSFRYYAVSRGKKSDLGTTWEDLLGAMTKNIFDDLKGKDEISF